MMYNNMFDGGLNWSFGNVMAQYFWLFPLAVVWSLAWKGIALWQAGQRKQLPWFIAILIVNTFGLLEIFYLFAYHYKPNGTKRKK